MKAIVLIAVITISTGIVVVYYVNQINLFGSTAPTVSEQIFKDDNTDSSVNKAEVNKKAGFTIFTNNTLRVFSAKMYHNLNKDVFIESTNPNIINIKKEGITWDDFFITLPFKLNRECLTTGTGETFCNEKSGTLKFYLNGRLQPDSLSQLINQGDKLLVSFGGETEQQIQRQFEKIPDPDF